ncbi:MAG TPA: ABC transporter ATP-binding protein [Thermotogota bacterium]|nr:ABC transporter ATP-binding protein [Thermotogota bacterium]HRW35548.1 ABC transporter ATP-binding protein [Thermotogota bacterium]
MSLMEVKDITVRFGGLIATSQITMDIEQGKIHSLIGPNGAGKTTMFNVITRVIKPNEGEILFDGESLLKLKPHEIIQSGIARTFQNLEIFKMMTVRDNFLVGEHVNINTRLTNEIFQTKRALSEESRSNDKASQIAEFLGLKNRLNSLTGMLPYGLQKMVEIGRALISSPRLLLLDEPAAGLNPSETEFLKEVIREIKAQGVTILLVEHDMSLVMDISDYITVMNFGKKIAQGIPQEIRTDPEVIKAYLGESKYA